MELVFATNNGHKLKEIRKLFGKRFRILSLSQIGYKKEIPEDHPTLDENASAKAAMVYEFCKIPVFADDTGLEVAFLDGAPGVFSARYAGNEQDDVKNVRKLLQALEGTDNRAARFRTVISLRWDTDKEMLFEGIVPGMIARKPAGNKGFGYDPVFIPEGFDKTFAQMTLREKNKISHRARAFHKLNEYLIHHML